MDQRHIWGAQYNREHCDIFDLQETIAQQIAVQLRVKLTSNESQRLRQRPTENAEAHELYLRARFFWNKLTPDGVNAAVELFNKAIQKDESYALAYIGLLDAYTYLNSPVEARKAASKALEIDPMSGEAHASLGFLTFLYDWDFKKADAEFSQAIELNPSYAQAHHWYAIYLANMGRHKDALREARRARELDPLSLLMNQTVGLSLYLARDFGLAIDELRKVVDMDANYAAVRSSLGLAYAHKGLTKEAIQEFRKVGDLAGGHPAVDSSVKALIAYTHAVSGEIEQARILIDEISNLPATSSYLLAMILGLIGETDLAFEWLDRAYQERNFQLVCALTDPGLDPLRGDARFPALLARIGLS